MEIHEQEWQHFKSGDRLAYSRIYEQHYALLCNYGHKFSRNTALIEDGIHDLFAKLWANRKNLGEPVSVKNYLFKAFRNIMIRKVEAGSRLDDLDDNYAFAFEPALDQSIELREEEREIRQKLRLVINALPARQREIVYLRFYEGMNYDEIAEVMAITVSSAYKTLYKALDKLHTLLKVSKTYLIVQLVFHFSQQNQIKDNFLS